MSNGHVVKIHTSIEDEGNRNTATPTVELPTITNGHDHTTSIPTNTSKLSYHRVAVGLHSKQNELNFF